MIAYKFLSAGAVGLFSRYAWPTPAGGVPGEWVRVDGELRLCLNGIHACAKARIVEWLDDELWEIELADPVLDAEGELLASGGRLIRRVERWDDDCARAFAGHCVEHTVALAAGSLARTGRKAEAEALAAAQSPRDAEHTVLELARDFADEPTGPIVFMADLARLERGGRPEHEEHAPAADAGGPTPAALAANLGYVCAYIAGRIAEQERPGAYDESFARERLRQSSWLAEELHLER